MRSSLNRTWVVITVAWLLCILAILPVLFHWPAATPRISRTQLAIWIGYATALVLCVLIYRAESRRTHARYAAAVALLTLFLTAVVNNVHSYSVDQVTNMFPYTTNEKWQETLQNNVINLRSDVAPHSYRFLPNGIVRWLEVRHVSFRAAADIYRLEFGILLFYAIYRFARLYTNFTGGVLSMAIVAAIFPVTFEQYAGQLTDPLSHLSFVLAFIFLESDNFPLLLTTLLIGSLAKETVLAMAGFYVLYGRRDKRFPIKAIGTCLAALASYILVRLYVLHGVIQYHNVSGVDPGHIPDNLTDKTWPELVILTIVGLVFFLVLSWKETPRSLKRLYFYLVPVLFVSSVFFSWIRETRNYVPVVIVLAVIAARFCTAPLASYCIAEGEPSEVRGQKTVH
jgi:hypothetical protein